MTVFTPALDPWRAARMLLVSGCLFLVPSLALGHEAHEHENATPRQGAASPYTKEATNYRFPNLMLTDMHGKSVSPAGELAREDHPMIMQFIFTTCPGVCPVLSAVMAGVQEELGQDAAGTRLWSITVDPEYDSPEKLRGYALNFGAGKNWRFFTGRREDIVAVQRAFDAYWSNKMDHRQLTFIYAPKRQRWLRLEGTVSAKQLVKELLELTSGRQSIR